MGRQRPEEQQAQNDQNHESFMVQANSQDGLIPDQLSGDESAERSLIATDITGAKANFLLTVATIMKTVIGAGILSLPYTISRLGYILGLIMSVIIICVIQFNAVMLLKAKNLSRHSNYSSISYHIFRSKFAQIACSSAILVNNIGVCILELTIIRETVHKIIFEYIDNEKYGDAWYLKPGVIVVYAAILEFPFTLVKKIERLKLLAFFGITGITIFVINLIVTFFMELPEQARGRGKWECHEQMSAFASDGFGMAIVIPNMMLALGYKMNFFPIFKGMKNSTDQKMKKASIYGVVACSIFYILVGNMGYCLFGNNLQGNFLLSFESEDTNPVTYILMNVGFLSSVFFSFPIMFFGGRNNFIAIVKNVMLIVKKKDQQYKQISDDQVEQISSYIETQDKKKRRNQANVLFIIFTIILFAFSVVIAAFVGDIEDVFNVIGAIAANCISFIFPALFYVMLVRKKHKQMKKHYYVAFGIVVFFIPFGIFSVISKFLQG